MAGDTKEIGGTELEAVDATDPLAGVIAATQKAATDSVATMRMVGAEIIRLDAAAAPVPLSQYPKLRVQFVVLNVITAGAISLQVGTVLYPFNLAANAAIIVPFPLLIERGTNMAAVAADGRIYLVGYPE